MSLKKESLLSMCAFSLLAVACGDDSSSDVFYAQENSTSDLVVPVYDDLPVCSSTREGVTAYVKDEKMAYICQDNVWMLTGKAMAPFRRVRDSRSRSLLRVPTTQTLAIRTQTLRVLTILMCRARSRKPPQVLLANSPSLLRKVLRPRAARLRAVQSRAVLSRVVPLPKISAPGHHLRRFRAVQFQAALFQAARSRVRLLPMNLGRSSPIAVTAKHTRS